MNLFLFQRHSGSHLSFSLDIQIHMLMIRYDIPLIVDSALYTIYFIDVSKMQYFDSLVWTFSMRIGDTPLTADRNKMKRYT